MSFSKTVCSLLLILTLASCYTSRHAVRDWDGQNIRVDATLAADTAIARLMRPYREGRNAAMHKVLGLAGVPLTKAQPECTMGNFVADAVLAAAKGRDTTVAAAVINYEALRISYLAPGPIRLGDLYQLMPFDDHIVFLDISGKTLLRFCNHIAAAGGWPVSGLQFRIDHQKAEKVLLNGHPVNPQLVYRIAVPDYIANGGADCDFLKKCPGIKQSILLRAAIIRYLKKIQNLGRQLRPEIENRITYAP